MIQDSESRTQLLNCLIDQARSADTWVREWVSHKDGAALKNAVFALGKVYGTYNVCLKAYEGGDLPEEAMNIITRYQTTYDELMRTYVRTGER